MTKGWIKSNNKNGDIKMTKLEQIMELLKDGELTSIEIAGELNIPKNHCASYLTALRKSGRIVKINDNIPYKYKLAKKPIELLKQLYELMDSKMDFVKKADNNDIELIKQIEQVINK